MKTGGEAVDSTLFWNEIDTIQKKTNIIGAISTSIRAVYAAPSQCFLTRSTSPS